MKKRLAVAGVALLCFFSVSCGPSDIDSAALPVAPEEIPQRIVSLSPATTEILFALGLDEQIVGVTTQCNYPPEAAEKPKVGDVDTSTERVVEAKPDLVVAHAFLNAKAIRALGPLGMRMVTIDPGTLEEVADSIQEIALACGRQETGEELAQSILSAMDEVSQKQANRNNPKPKVLFAAQGLPLWAAGPDTFVDEMVQINGAKNVASGIQGGSFSLFSEEAAVSANPDFIFVTDETSRNHFLKSSAWRNTAAVKSDRVMLVDPDLYVRPGPRLADGLREMSDILLTFNQTRQ